MGDLPQIASMLLKKRLAVKEKGGAKAPP